MTRTGAFLVTGAGSGIGRHLVERLADQGHLVFAGARAASDREALGRLDRVTPVALDVTRPEQLAEVVAQVVDAGRGLDGLVNNAALGGLGPLASWSEQELRELFDVNLFGPWRVTNAFLPLLLESRGRIVNIGSQGGLIAQPHFGPYCMTKHALEAYTATLRDELSGTGVGVSIVDPGGVATSIVEKSMPGTLGRLRRAPEPFRRDAATLARALEQPSPGDPEAPESTHNRKPSPPALVGDAVEHALFAERPEPHYLVGTRWEGDRVLDALARRLVSAAAAPSHRLSRDELIALVDGHLARTGRHPAP